MQSNHDSTLPNIDKLWNYNDPSGTRTKFNEVLTDDLKSTSPLYYAELMTQIARTYSLEHSYDSAHQHLDKIQSLLPDNPGRVSIRYQLERGRTFNSAGEKELALSHFKSAWKMGREINEDGLAVDAAHMIAIAEKPDSALKWNEKALKLAESSSQPTAKKWLGSLYNNIGWTYHDLKRYDEALVLFQQALDWREEKGEIQSILIAQWCIARTLRSLNKYEEALEMQIELGKSYQQHKLAADPYVSEEMGECLYALGKKNEAKPCFRQAYELFSADKWMIENENEKLNRLKELAQ